MKKSYFSKLLIIGVFFAFTVNLQAQKQIERKKISGKYNQEKLNLLKKGFQEKSSLEKQRAIKIAKEKGWKVKFTNKKGDLLELQKVVNGQPIYYTTFNVAAAKSTRVDHLNSGGSLGLSLDGQNMTAYVWDGGVARASHQEYDGAGGNNRFSTGDSGSLNYHSAHVTGTIIASGVVSNAKGMASHAQAIGYDWNSDLAEATSAAANGMLISNHSYGFAARNQQGQVQLPQYYFGGYITDSRDWDNLMFNAPNYLMVVAAGNDGTDDSANTNPTGGFGFDKLTGHSTSKNNLVVAAANDANIDSNGNLLSATIANFSSEGPTDDFRIKPDIAGNGVSVYSTYDSSDTAYNSISGTSMASPNVTGSLILLQQHHNNLNNSYMKAATLKGLALHTADDAGASGPDAVFGWGLLNTKAAAEAITNKGNESKIEELTLTSGQTYTISVDSDGINPLFASISWTDRAGTANTGTVNLTTPVLVNDLDIRVTKGGTSYLPYELTGATTNAKKDNDVDPYERVDVANASGTYTITITNKGSLIGGSQNYSLIVTGLTGVPVVCNATTPANLIIDGFGSSSATASWDIVTGTSYDFRYRQTGASTWITSAVAGTSTSLSALSPQTSYEVQIRSTCPDNTASAYSASVSFITAEVQLNYCASNGNSVADEYISKVILGSINNTTGAAGSGYADYTSQSTNLTKGTSATITITPTWTATLYNEGYAVFIDYNKDGDFDDSGETVWTKAASQATPVSGSFTVPTSAISGTTRMRVILAYNAIPASCGTYNYGETEDYTVNITNGVADTTVPIITLSGSSIINLNVGDSFTDPGATASDTIDGNLTSSIVVTGSVNTGTAGTYILNYNVSDAAGNTAAQVSRTINVNEVAADTEAPTAPTNLTASAITETTATLSWSTSTDNFGVTAYEVFSNGTSIGTITSASANITGLVANTSYSYTVSAKDAAGNVSTLSNTASFTTLASPSGSTTIVHEGSFEAGWDGWSDGGSDCYRYSGSRSYEGNNSIRLRDNSGTGSAMTSSAFNLTSYNSVEVSFFFYSYSMENNEDFWLRFYNGSSWSTVSTWSKGTSFENNNFYSATITLNSTDVNFASNSAFRFQNDASGNNDHIYIDQVIIKGIIGDGGNSTNSINKVNTNYNSTTSSTNDEFGDKMIYPNPAIHVLNVNPNFGTLKATYRITNLLGKVITSGTIKNNSVNISALKNGIYLIELTDEEETFTQKFIKQ
jgi:hypothetical protein